MNQIQDVLKNIRKSFSSFYKAFYKNFKKQAHKLWGICGLAFILGIISGVGMSRGAAINGFFAYKSAGFGSEILLHTAYFCIIYLTVANFYCAGAGLTGLLFVSFKLGGTLSAATITYGLGGLIQSIFILLPVNVIMLLSLSSFLIVCMNTSGVSRKSLTKQALPYKTALISLLYFLVPVVLTDILAWIII